MNESPLERQASIYRNVRDTFSTDTIAIGQFVDGIRSGRWKNEVESYRANLSDEVKKRLQCVTPAGRFSERNKTALIGTTGVMVLDYDKVGTLEDAERIREKVQSHPSAVGAFVSPSGNGVKVLVRVDVKDDADVKRAFPQIVRSFSEFGTVNADESGKDICRLCFVSYDPGAWMRDDAQPIDISTDDEVMPRVESTPLFDQRLEVRTDASDNPEAIRHVTNIISKAGRDAQRPGSGVSRHDAMRNACVTAWGYHYGGHLTEATARAVILHEYSKLFPGDAERLKDAERAFESGKDKAAEKAPLHPTSATSEAPMTPEQISALWDYVFLPSWDNEPEPIPPVVTFAADVLPSPCEVCHAGTLTAIVAQYSTGKSTVSSAIWAGAYADGDHDLLGFKVHPPPGRPRAVYIDSEQATTETWPAWQRALQRIGKHGAGDASEASETWMCFSRLPSNKARQELVFKVLEDDQNFLVFIDGVADFIDDVNNAKEVDQFMQRLRTAADERQTAVILTIHKNKGTDEVNPRGHLGSDILRRASCVLNVSKNRDSGIHEIRVDKLRRGRSGIVWRFRWDDEAMRHVSMAGASGAIRAASIGILDKLEAHLMGMTSKTIRRQDLDKIIMEIDEGMKNKSGRSFKRVLDDAVKAGFLTARPGGKLYDIIRPSEVDENEVLF
jgi:hypothetical protein